MIEGGGGGIVANTIISNFTAIKAPMIQSSLGCSEVPKVMYQLQGSKPAAYNVCSLYQYCQA